MEQIFKLDTRNRPGVLISMMHALAAEDSWISFEGRLAHTELARMERVVYEESGVLKRGTLWPKQDFLVLPLAPQNVAAIEKAIVSKITFGNGGIIHVQIEKNGKMAFAAYDNFQHVVAYPAVPALWLDELIETGDLRNYQRVVKPTG
jgi:hypothetical protein